MSNVIIIAHRGASRTAPENTLPAIKKALEAGAEMLALEIQKTRDNLPVVLADASLDRTTNGTGRVARLSLAEVQALDAGSWFNQEFAARKSPRSLRPSKALAKKRG